MVSEEALISKIRAVQRELREKRVGVIAERRKLVENAFSAIQERIQGLKVPRFQVTEAGLTQVTTSAEPSPELIAAIERGGVQIEREGTEPYHEGMLVTAEMLTAMENLQRGLAQLTGSAFAQVGDRVPPGTVRLRGEQAQSLNNALQQLLTLFAKQTLVSSDITTTVELANRFTPLTFFTLTRGSAQFVTATVGVTDAIKAFIIRNMPAPTPGSQQSTQTGPSPDLIAQKRREINEQLDAEIERVRLEAAKQTDTLNTQIAERRAAGLDVDFLINQPPQVTRARDERISQLETQRNTAMFMLDRGIIP